MTFLRPRNMAIAIREIEPNEIPSCSMSHPLIAYTWRLDMMSNPCPSMGCLFSGKTRWKKGNRHRGHWSKNKIPQNFKGNTKILVQNYRFVLFFTVCFHVHIPAFISRYPWDLFAWLMWGWGGGKCYLVS